MGRNQDVTEHNDRRDTLPRIEEFCYLRICLTRSMAIVSVYRLF